MVDLQMTLRDCFHFYHLYGWRCSEDCRETPNCVQAMKGSTQMASNDMVGNLRSFLSDDYWSKIPKIFEVTGFLNPFYNFCTKQTSHSTINTFVFRGSHCIFGHLLFRQLLLIEAAFLQSVMCLLITGFSNHLNSLGSLQTFAFVVVQLEETFGRHDVCKQCHGGKHLSNAQMKCWFADSLNRLLRTW